MHTKLNLSVKGFGLLDANMASLEEALSLLKDVVSLAPKLLICVLDGMHLVDNENDIIYYLDTLLRILRKGSRKLALEGIACK